MLKFNLGDKVIDTSRLHQGICTIVELDKKNLMYSYQIMGSTRRVQSGIDDIDLVPVEIYESPLFNTMREND